MTLEIFLRYLHFISIFIVFSSLVAEHLLLKKTLPRKEISRLARIDAIYGIAALSILIAGLSLWFGDAGKPAEFYSANWIFHLKVSLFVLVGLLSIYPTVFFIKQRKGQPEDLVEVPKTVFVCLRIELLLLVIIPLLAALMARGVGYQG